MIKLERKERQNGASKLARFGEREPLYDHEPSFRSARANLASRVSDYEDALETKGRLGSTYSAMTALEKARESLQLALGDVAIILLEDGKDALALKALGLLHDGSVNIKDKVAVRALLSLAEGFHATGWSQEASSSSQSAQDPPKP